MVAERRMDQLDRHLAVQRRVARTVHLAHAALADFSDDLVAAEPSAGCIPHPAAIIGWSIVYPDAHADTGMRRFLAVFTLILSTAGIHAGRDSRPVELKPGDAAPLFSLPGSDGRTYRLTDYAGKQVVVLAWFAKAFTSG